MASARHGTEMGRKTGAGPTVDSKAEAIAEVMLEVAQGFFRIPALGQKTGLITSWGGGAFGFMRSALRGPLTVPQIAQMRPTSRQRMQRLVDELAAEGLVQFIDNPKHRRSKRCAADAQRRCALPRARGPAPSIASTMCVALGEPDVRRTIDVVRQLSDHVKARSERLS